MADAPFLPTSISSAPLLDRSFVSRGTSPAEGLVFEERVSILKGVDGGSEDKGKVVVPVGWSENASDVLCQKYLRRAGVPSKTVQLATGLGRFDRSVPADGASFGGETDLRQAAHRMAGCWSSWGVSSGLLTTDEAEALYDDASFLLLHQAFAPNSPQWFNTGLHWAYGIGGPSEGHYHVDPTTSLVVETTTAYERPAPHACFIQSVSDDLVNDGGIMDLWVREARVFKFGGGTGSSFGAIRGKGESLSGGGSSSGLMSWLRIGDRSAAGIQSGGTTRRAAKMVVLPVDHPEIEEFVDWKSVEEEKVAALVTGSRVNRRAIDRVVEAVDGYQSSNCVDHADRYDPTKNEPLRVALRLGRKDGVPDQFLVRAVESLRNDLEVEPNVYGLDWQGPAYDTVSGQQSNNSVSIPHAFMEAALDGREWSLVGRRAGTAPRTISAGGLWDKICRAAWICADPGLQFSDTINDWHTCQADGRINSSNPCAEYLFLDDTACNLASINLVAFLRPDGSFDLDGYVAAARVVTTVLEISVTMATLPSEIIARRTFDYRTLGLGVANLGALLMRMGVPYDSDEGRRIAAGLVSLLTATAYDQSGRMASRVGPFERWETNRAGMTRVLSNHRAAAHGNDPDVKILPPKLDLSVIDRAEPILMAARSMWDSALSHASGAGYRNAQVSCIAPTGTIAIEMDCDTTGIEPDFSLVKHKTLAGGGFMKIVNRSVPAALRQLGYDEARIRRVEEWVVGTGRLPETVLQTFLRRGLSADAVRRIYGALRSSLDLRAALLPDVVGREELAKLGIDPSSDVAAELGLSDDLVRMATEDACGHQTVEGCPDLDPAHLPVFDCANRCGRTGTRFIRADGHLLMLAALQPFLSGASSKTVNLPAGASVADVRRVYVTAWRLGIKCVALYVDGSKFSQPLSSVRAAALFGDLDPASPADRVRIVERVVEKIVEKVVVRHISERRRLANQRKGYTQKVTIGSHKVFLRTGEYSDGTLGEIFVDSHKDGTSFKSMLSAFAIAVSVGLQHGVPLERFVDLFTFTKFEPNGIVAGDDRIFMCTSLLDWIFRHLAVHYAGRDDLATVPAPDAYDPSTIGEGESDHDPQNLLLSAASIAPPTILAVRAADVRGSVGGGSSSGSVEVFSGTFEGEWCDRCGNFSLVKQGTCSKCANPHCRSEAGGCG